MQPRRVLCWSLLHLLTVLSLVLAPFTQTVSASEAPQAVSAPARAGSAAGSTVVRPPTVDSLVAARPLDAGNVAASDLATSAPPTLIGSAAEAPVDPLAGDDPGATPSATPEPLPISVADDVTIGPAGGVLQSMDGRITVVVPAGAVAAATRFRYAASSFAANQGRSYLAGSIIRLTAEDAASAVPIRSFATPLTLRTTIDAATLRDAAWHPRRLCFYYFDADAETWVAMASETDGQGSVSAHTTHFTDFGVGMAPQDKIVPSVHSSATVDAWTGAATFSYPIEVVPGRNGLQPSVSLRYSSGSVDDMYNSDQNWGTYHRQANYVGLGWSLGGVSGVIRDHNGTQEYLDDDTFYLNLNGSFKLVFVQTISQFVNEYRADPDQGWRIYQEGSTDRLGGNACNRLASPSPTDEIPQCRWHVWLADGTQYLFTGTTSYAYATYGSGCSSFSTWVVGSGWSTSLITDTHGNTIAYGYDLVHNTHTACTQTLTDHSWAYPLTIDYAPGAQVALAYTSRNDTISYGPAQYGDLRLDTMTVKQNGTTVRQYALAYDYGHAYRTYGGAIPGRLLLASITQWDGATPTPKSLPPYQFSYVQCQDMVNWCNVEDSDWKRDNLQVVDNGVGGRVEYQYAARAYPQYHKDGETNGSLHSAGIQATSLQVAKRMWFGGVGNFFQETYAYGTPLGQVKSDDGGQLRGYEFLGHDWTEVTTNTGNGAGTTERVVKQWFYQWPKPGAYLADPRKGKVFKQETTGPGLANPARQETNYAIVSQNGVSLIYRQAVTDTLDSKSALTTYTIDGYGNVTGEYGYGDLGLSGDERTITRTFLANTTPWIMNRVQTQGTYTGTVPDGLNGTYVAAFTHYAYDGSDPANCAVSTAAPTTGDLTRTCTWISGAIGSPTFAATRYGYDQWGNQIVITDAKSTPGITWTKFDDIYHTFALVMSTTVTGTLLLTQTQAVDYATGQPTDVWDANGVRTQFFYDTFKRLVSVVKPPDTTSYPTTQYSYNILQSPYLRNGNMERWSDWTLVGTNVSMAYSTSQARSGERSLAVTTQNGSDAALVKHASLTTVLPGKKYIVSAKVYRTTTNPTATLQVYDGFSTLTVASTNGGVGAWEMLRGMITVASNATTFEVRLWVGGLAGTVYLDDVQAIMVPILRTDRRESGGAAGTLWSRQYFDGLGRLIETQAEYNGSQVIFQDSTYSALDWKTSDSVPYLAAAPSETGDSYRLPESGQARTYYGHDALGRTTAVTNTDSTVVKTAYDGWRTAVLDENGHEKIVEADAFGQTKVITETTGTYSTPGWTPIFYAKTTYTYDTLGNLVGVDNTDNTTHYTTSLSYDRGSRKVSMVDPDMGTWRYWYDAVGNLTIQQDARTPAQVICFYYDRMNRPTGKEYRSNTSCSGSPTVITYTYDSTSGGNMGKGRRTGMTDASGNTTWTYDQRGRLTAESKVVSGQGTFTSGWSYDALDRVATMTYPGGEVVSSGYNVMGAPQTLTAPGRTFVADTAYTAAGQVDLRKLGPAGTNQVLEDYIYFPWATVNGRGRLQELKTGISGDLTKLQNFTYTYDAVANVTVITDTKTALPPNSQVQTFTYDALNRLSSAQAQGGSGGIYNQESYVYNFAGNLTTKGSLTLSYNDANHKHAVSSAGAWQYVTYDGNGNLTRRYDGYTTSEDYIYDAENRLVQAKHNDAVVGSYGYDGDGKQVTATVNSVTTVYIGGYYEKTGSAVKKYYAIGGARVAMDDNGTVRYLLTDHLGSTAKTANTDASQYGELRYKAWGENRYSGGTTPTSYHFTGQREESGLAPGLYFYGARWYDSAWGRFLQADTIVPQPGNPQGLNRYAYALSNPVKYNDPSGHWVETAWDIANVAWDIHELANDRSVGNFVALAVDAGAVLLPFVPAGVGILLRGGKIADKALDAAKVVSKADALGDSAEALVRLGKATTEEATGQMHHLLPEKVTRELAKHKTLQGVLSRTDPRLVFQAKDEAAHRGYQTWHRQVDDEVVRWLGKHDRATPVEFLDFLQDLYQRADVKDHIPGVDLTDLIQEVGP